MFEFNSNMMIDRDYTIVYCYFTAKFIFLVYLCKKEKKLNHSQICYRNSNCIIKIYRTIT